MPVWAVSLPDGNSLQASLSQQGTFAFDDIPIDQYLIVLDPNGLAQEGYRYRADQVANLTDDFEEEVTLSLTAVSGKTLHGKVMGETGTPLPFAWVAREERTGIAQGVLPDSGTYTLHGMPPDNFTLVASAPGFYSEAQAVDVGSGETAVHFILKLQPQTQQRPWGSGTLLIPAESQVTQEDGALQLERGWLWGEGDGAEPLVIHTSAATITLSGSRFALEYLPGQRAWLYIFDGEAAVKAGGAERIIVTAGQMLNLFNDEGLQAAPFDPVVLTALRPAGNAPLPFVWEPTLGAQIRNRLERIGIGMAQALTLVTYLVIIGAVVVAPLLALFLWWRRRRVHQTG